ncbi:hypothetical protein [Hymenobacter polaris]|nr:hypothetical protein [Hymenobacter polaris]
MEKKGGVRTVAASDRRGLKGNYLITAASRGLGGAAGLGLGAGR